MLGVSREEEEKMEQANRTGANEQAVDNGFAIVVVLF